MREWVQMAVVVVGGLATVVAMAFVGRHGVRNAWGMLRYDRRRRGALRVGGVAPDARLATLDGGMVRLHSRLGARPVVLAFGSYT